MNNRQKWQLGVGSLFAVLLIIWLFMPEWGAVKILGIVSDLLGVASMVISYLAEERGKNSK